MQSLFFAIRSYRIVSFALVIAALSFFAPRLKAQDCGGRSKPGAGLTNAGTEFLICFMENAPEETNIKQEIILASVSDSSAVVTITCKNFPTLNRVIPLQPHTSAIFDVPQNEDGIIHTDEIVDPTVFRVVSTSPITCYGLNSKHYSADAFLALPDSIALFDYMVMSYYNSMVPGLEHPSEFCVAAFQDNTNITVTCTAKTKNGTALGVPVQYTLDSGTTIQFQSNLDSGGDLTGSTISSNKRIVVYGGHVRTEVPTGYTYGGGSTSRDHLADAIPPVADWGWSFVTKNFGRDSGDIMRVVAKNDNTEIKINGIAWGKPLKSGQFRDTLIANSLEAQKNILAVESDAQHPLLVGMIAHTAATGSDRVGDPFLAIVPPLTQGFNDFTYFIVDDPRDFDPNENFLTIVTEKDGIGSAVNSNISIDGIPIPRQAFAKIQTLLNNGNQYYITTVTQTPGIHRIVGPTVGNSAQGFSILAYGWGEVISYGYTAGALFKPQTGIAALKNPSPSIAPRSNPPSSITVRDMLNERVYFDSSKITYTQNKNNNIVRFKKDLVMETGSLNPVQEKTLELVAMNPIEDVIKGTIRIWYHSALWTDLIPVDFPFTVTAGSTAGVHGEAAKIAATLENFPNPSMGRSTITFSIPSRAYATVKIYDALGRMVRTVSSGTVDEGLHAVGVSGLPSGSYTVELSAPEIGVSEHVKLIIM